MTRPSTNNPDLLIVFVKAPRKGQVKTRLAAQIGEEFALRLYQAMVKDLMENIQPAREYDIHVLVWPHGTENVVRNWLDWNGYISSQGSGDLGKKLFLAFKKSFRKGYKRVIIIGSDLPGISSDLISSGLKRLHKYPLVLGPAVDGGYYLIGLNSLQPQLFSAMNWSTSGVLRETIRRAQQSDLSFQLLKELRDIDTFEDVAALWKIIQNRKRDDLIRSADVIQDIMKQYHAKNTNFTP